MLQQAATLNGIDSNSQPQVVTHFQFVTGSLMLEVEQQVFEEKSLDKRECATIRTVSSRLAESRELCNHTQIAAAKLLGLPAKEFKAIEAGLDIDYIPLWVIQKAAAVYDVSVDFLFGLNADWETGDIEIRKRRDFLAVMERMHIDSQAATIVKQIKEENKIQALTDAVAMLAPAMREVYEAVLRFWELNPAFEEMPGGSTVLYKLDQAEKKANAATAEMVRFKCLQLEATKEYSADNPFGKDNNNVSQAPYPTADDKAGHEAWKRPSTPLARAGAMSAECSAV